MTHFFFFVSCVDLMTNCPAVEHKPLMAFIEAISSSHKFIANESPSGDKVINTVWMKPGKQVTLASKSTKVNVVYVRSHFLSSKRFDQFY